MTWIWWSQDFIVLFHDDCSPWEREVVILPTLLLRKEVIHPHLPVRIPCYDLVLIADLAVAEPLHKWLRSPASGIADFAGLTGSVYKKWERIHRNLLICDYYRFQLHEGKLQPSIRTEGPFRGLAQLYSVATRCRLHCRMCVAPDVRDMLTWRRPLLPPCYQQGSLPWHL